MKTLVWLLDEVLDRLPRREGGRWLRYGDWGCRMTYKFPALRWWDERR